MATTGPPANPPRYSEVPLNPINPQVVGSPGIGASPPQVVPGTVTTVQTTAFVPVVVGKQMGPKPAVKVCESCNNEIVTVVKTKATMRTHIFALLLCLIGFWPCVIIPYCMDSCNNADHYCPNCNAYIGSYIN